jgi:hypothetical protein
MMTEYEAQKLRERMFRELNVGPLAVWQCAAGLLIVIGLAVGGTVFDLRPNTDSGMAQTREHPQATVNSANSEEQGQAYAATPSPAEDRPALISVGSASVVEAR